MSARKLAREDILSLQGYRPAEQITGSIRLNANEAPLSLGNSDDTTLNRYPDAHPARLQQRMAELFSVPAQQLLVTRGSSEAIDVLVRTFCHAYADNIIAATPSFEMYRFYAAVQGVELIEVALQADQAFRLDVENLLEKCDNRTKLIFLCSPNNPTGGLVAENDILKLVRARRNLSIVVVDEAYIEFSERISLAESTHKYDNLVVLRTLSKAYALAGARCGAAIACTDLINVLVRVLPPYSFATPVVQRILTVLGGDGFRHSSAAISEIINERQRMFDTLVTLPTVANLWPSQANFLLVQFHDCKAMLSHLQAARILVRDFSAHPGLHNCVRITIGSPTENDALLAALAAVGTGA